MKTWQALYFVVFYLNILDKLQLSWLNIGCWKWMLLFVCLLNVFHLYPLDSNVDYENSKFFSYFAITFKYWIYISVLVVLWQVFIQWLCLATNIFMNFISYCCKHARAQQDLRHCTDHFNLHFAPVLKMRIISDHIIDFWDWTQLGMLAQYATEAVGNCSNSAQLLRDKFGRWCIQVIEADLPQIQKWGLVAMETGSTYVKWEVFPYTN